MSRREEMVRHGLTEADSADNAFAGIDTPLHSGKSNEDTSAEPKC